MVDRQRTLQGLAAVSREGEHAFGNIAVKFEIDLRQRYRAADHIGLRLQREPLEAAARQRLLAEPDHRTPKRRRNGRGGAFDFQCWPGRYGAVKGELERRAGDAQFQCRAFALQRGAKLASVTPISRFRRDTGALPVTAKLREIAGQASDRSASETYS